MKNINCSVYTSNILYTYIDISYSIYNIYHILICHIYIYSVIYVYTHIMYNMLRLWTVYLDFTTENRKEWGCHQPPTTEAWNITTNGWFDRPLLLPSLRMQPSRAAWCPKPQSRFEKKMRRNAQDQSLCGSQVLPLMDASSWLVTPHGLRQAQDGSCLKPGVLHPMVEKTIAGGQCLRLINR